MIYMHPKRRLMRAQSKEKIAKFRVRGSSAALWICRIVRMALSIRKQLQVSKFNERRARENQTHDKRRTEIILNVFHSLITESMNASHVDFNLSYSGGTLLDSKTWR
jgi:hypothetical protein